MCQHTSATHYCCISKRSVCSTSSPLHKANWPWRAKGSNTEQQDSECACCKCKKWLLIMIFCRSVVAMLEAVCWHQRSLGYWCLYEVLCRKGDACCNKWTAVNSASFLLWLCPHARCAVRVGDGKQYPILCWSVDCIYGLCRCGCFQVKMVNSCQVSTVCLRKKNPFHSLECVAPHKTHHQLEAWHGNNGDFRFYWLPCKFQSFEKLISEQDLAREYSYIHPRSAGMATQIVTPDWSNDWFQHPQVIDPSILWLSWQNWWKNVWLWCCSVSTL